MYGWTLLGSIVIAAAAWVLFSGWLSTWRTWRGVRLITCPENLQVAAVSVDAFNAAKSFAVAGETELHLNRCSRWPEMSGCDQACLSQVESAPITCRLHSIVTSWYEDKHCHYCSREIGEIVWHDRPPALRTADGAIRTWKAIAPEELPETFSTATPVCWMCWTVENFRNEHPRMIVERPRMADVHQAIPPSAAVY